MRQAPTALFELAYLSWLILTLKDWFWSSASPFPYCPAMGLTAGVAISLVVYSCTPTIGNSAFRLLARIFPDGTRTSFALRSRVLAVIAALLALFSGILVIRALTPLPALGNSADAWLGKGLGTDTSPAQPWGALLVAEQGWGIVFALGALTGICVWMSLIASVKLLRSSEVPQEPLRMVSRIIALAVICCLFLHPWERYACLTCSSVIGTWIFALTAAWIGGLHLPGLALPSAPMQARRRSWAVRLWAGGAAAVCAVALVLQIPLDGAVAHYSGSGIPERRSEFCSLASISPVMQDATIAMEDHAFYQHHGFDWAAMHHALRMDLRDGRIEEGGSTITQQLAKNLFLSNDRTVWRKIEEAAYAWELERMLPKPRILELYLNTIDYGMGQHGVTAAARYYFHKTPDKLTLTESAILVGIVPDPMHQQVDSQRILDGRQTALGRMRYFFPHRYSQAEVDRAAGDPLDRVLYPDKDAWDRGATYEIPDDWHGVKFYLFADPQQPLPIDRAALCLKERLAGFLEDARQNLHVTGIDHLGVYNDRTMRQSATATSAHAFGQAIDISGFRFADGSRVSVKDHGNPRVMARLAPLEAMLRRHFDIVVDWNDDPKRHQTHFHTEVKGPRPTAPRPYDDASPGTTRATGD